MNSITQWLRCKRMPCCCTLCGYYHKGEDAVCNMCHEFLAPILFACTHCALPLPEGRFLICGQCIRKKPNFDLAIAPYTFEEPLRTLLHEFKYHRGLHLVSFLAKLIINNLPPQATNTECLIPVPLHTTRLHQRGFNQAAELAKYIGKTLNIPYELNVCEKIIQTLPQAGLTATERRQNLSNAFMATRLSYKHVTLIDDLLTTGSTANELTKILKKNGVEHVSVWCCARVTDERI